MKSLDLSIIIVSFNTKEFVLACLESLKKTIEAEILYEVIVVDNNSSDGSVEAIRKEHDWVHVIASETNNGFAKANNMGVKKSSGRYVLFLNPDTIVYEHVIKRMLSFMDEHEKAGASTSKLEMENKTIDYASHRGFPTPWNALSYFSGLTKVFPKSKLFSGYTQGWKDMSKVHQVDCIAGAFMFVRRTAGEEVGWWDEDYFFNGEDIDFCFELREKGWEIWYVPDVTILHYNGVAGGTKKHTQHLTTADTERKRFVQEQRFKAMKIFYEKHYRHKYPRFITWSVMKAIDMKKSRTLRQSL